MVTVMMMMMMVMMQVSKKMIILNHWGKQKPVESDLEKLYVEELTDR